MFLAGSVISFITSSLSSSFTCSQTNKERWGRRVGLFSADYIHVCTIMYNTSYVREASKVYWMLVSNNISFLCTKAWMQLRRRAIVSLSSLKMGYIWYVHILASMIRRQLMLTHVVAKVWPVIYFLTFSSSCTVGSSSLGFNSICWR